MTNEMITPNTEQTEVETDRNLVLEAGQTLCDRLTDERFQSEKQFEKTFEALFVELPANLPESERIEIATKAAEEALAVANDGFDLVDRHPYDLLDLQKWVGSFRKDQFITVTNPEASALTTEQKYVAGAILTYWVLIRGLKGADKEWIETNIVNTWLAHPETDVEVFYRRYMHFYNNKFSFESIRLADLAEMEAWIAERNGVMRSKDNQEAV